MLLSKVSLEQTTSPMRMAALGLFVLAGALLGWRAVDVFTAPSGPEIASPFTALVETVTGAGTARVAAAESGQMLVLIDGPEGALSSATVTQISQMASALYPHAPPPIVRQYPFAVGVAARPADTALGELAALGLLTVIAGWFALTLSSARASPAPMEHVSSPSPRNLRQMPLETPAASAQASLAAPSSVEEAVELATGDPRATAAIIKTWLRQEGGHA